MSLVITPSRWLPRGGTAADLAAVNEVPLVREIIFETDTGLFKLGDGVTHYNSLPYAGIYPASAQPYDNATSGLAATTTQDAIDELAATVGGGGDASIGVTFNGGGTVLPASLTADVQVPWDCTINAATLVADQSGSLVVSVWKDTFVNFPPTSGDNIAASAPPTLSVATASRDTTLTGWTTSLTKGDWIRFTVQSCTSITRAVLALEVTKP